MTNYGNLNYSFESQPYSSVNSREFVIDNIGNKDIKYIVDDNDLKQNKFTPGKNIKIINFNRLKNINFDLIIILAWNFAKPIAKKLKENFKNKRFKIIIPFPKLKII